MRLKEYLRSLRRGALAPFHRYERKLKSAAERFVVKTVAKSCPVIVERADEPPKMIAVQPQIAIPPIESGATKLMLAFLKATRRSVPTERKGFEAVALGDGRILVPHPTSGFMYSNTSDVKVLPQLILNSYQEQVTIAIEREFKVGNCVIQIGAEQGYHTLTIANTVGETGRVLALENRSSELALLRTNIEAHSLEDRVNVCEISNEEPFPFLQFLSSNRSISTIYVSSDHEIPVTWLRGLTEFFGMSSTTGFIVGTRRQSFAEYVASRKMIHSKERRAA